MQSTSYYGREYVREVFNESTKSKALKNLHQRVFATLWQKNDGYYYRWLSRQNTSQQSTQTDRHHTEKITITTKQAINEKRRLEI